MIPRSCIMCWKNTGKQIRKGETLSDTQHSSISFYWSQLFITNPLHCTEPWDKATSSLPALFISVLIGFFLHFATSCILIDQAALHAQSIYTPPHKRLWEISILFSHCMQRQQASTVMLTRKWLQHATGQLYDYVSFFDTIHLNITK